MKVLVTGFGAFGMVSDNPAARIARALHGWSNGPISVTAEEIPVEYEAGPAVTVRRAREIGAGGVLGIGVATGRTQAWVEAWASRFPNPALSDNRGIKLQDLNSDGPEGFENEPFSRRIAEAMGIGVSRDAGRYVCNAWLYRVGLALPDLPVVFIHVPEQGIPAEQFHRAFPVFYQS